MLMSKKYFIYHNNVNFLKRIVTFSSVRIGHPKQQKRLGALSGKYNVVYFFLIGIACQHSLMNLSSCTVNASGLL